MTRFPLVLLSLLLSTVASAGILLGPESVLSSSSYTPEHPAIAAAGDTTLVVWIEGDAASRRIEGTLILSNDSQYPIEIANGEVGDSSPRVASDGSSSFLVVWAAGEGLRARRINADGTAGAMLCLTASPAANPSIAFAAGAYVVAWEVPQDLNPLYYVGMGTRVVAERFDRLGTPLDAAPQLIAGENYPPAFSPSVASDGNQILIVWTEGLLCRRAACQQIAAYDLYGRLFGEDLSPHSNIFSISADSGVNEVNARVLPTTGGWFVAWTAWRGLSIGGVIADRGWTTLLRSGLISAEVRPPLEDVFFNGSTFENYVDRDSAAVAGCGSAALLATIDSYSGVAVLECAPYVDESASFEAHELAMANVGARVLVVYTRTAAAAGSDALPQVFLRWLAVEPRQRKRAVR